MSNRDPPYRMF